MMVMYYKRSRRVEKASPQTAKAQWTSGLISSLDSRPPNVRHGKYYGNRVITTPLLLQHVTPPFFLLSKIKKGKIPVEKTIDLHGYSLEDARQLFIQVIKDCYFKDIRCLLFITGKGAGKKNNHDQTQTKLFYGKIRNDFLNWARHESIQQKILLVHQASAKYGGDGAFFIYLRRRKF